MEVNEYKVGDWVMAKINGVIDTSTLGQIVLIRKPSIYTNGRYKYLVDFYSTNMDFKRPYYGNTFWSDIIEKAERPLDSYTKEELKAIQNTEEWVNYLIKLKENEHK